MTIFFIHIYEIINYILKIKFLKISESELIFASWLSVSPSIEVRNFFMCFKLENDLSTTVVCYIFKIKD